jgi:hypothetical protein
VGPSFQQLQSQGRSCRGRAGRWRHRLGRSGGHAAESQLVTGRLPGAPYLHAATIVLAISQEGRRAVVGEQITVMSDAPVRRGLPGPAHKASRWLHNTRSITQTWKRRDERGVPNCRRCSTTPADNQLTSVVFRPFVCSTLRKSGRWVYCCPVGAVGRCAACESNCRGPHLWTGSPAIQWSGEMGSGARGARREMTS